MQKLTAEQCKKLAKQPTYEEKLVRLAQEYRARGEVTDLLPAVLSGLYVALTAPRLTDFSGTPEDIIQACQVDAKIRELLRKYITARDLSIIHDIAESWKTEELCAAILWGTLPSRRDLVAEVFTTVLDGIILQCLDLAPVKDLLDLRAHAGRFMMELFCTDPTIRVTFQAITNADRDIAILRASLIAGETSVIAEMGPSELHRFDSAIVHPVLGERWTEEQSKFVVSLLEVANLGAKETVSAEWVQAFQVLEAVNDTGQAATLFGIVPLQSERDLALRKFFVDSGFITAVVALPRGVLAGTTVSPHLVLLGHQSTGIRFVDATDLGTRIRGAVEFSPDDYKELKVRMSIDSAKSSFASMKKVQERGYLLDPVRYLYRVSFRYAQPLENVMKSLTRGTQISSRVLESIKSSVPTNKWFLNVRDIRGGFLSNADDPDGIFLKEIPNRLRKYTVTDGMIILTRRGMQGITTAVAHVKDGEEILACPNVYLLDLDETKINPYYLQAFFESTEGQEALGVISNGSLITQQELKTLEIPVPPINEQERIATKYRELSEQAQELQAKLAATVTEMSDVWEDTSI